jgi:hypothetical protein
MDELVIMRLIIHLAFHKFFQALLFLPFPIITSIMVFIRILLMHYGTVIDGFNSCAGKNHLLVFHCYVAEVKYKASTLICGKQTLKAHIYKILIIGI